MSADRFKLLYEPERPILFKSCCGTYFRKIDDQPACRNWATHVVKGLVFNFYVCESHIEVGDDSQLVEEFFRDLDREETLERLKEERLGSRWRMPE